MLTVVLLLLVCRLSGLLLGLVLGTLCKPLLAEYGLVASLRQLCFRFGFLIWMLVLFLCFDLLVEISMEQMYSFLFNYEDFLNYNPNKFFEN